MATIKEMVAMVAPFVPQAPNPVIEQKVLEIYYEFCRTTRSWRGEIYPFETIPGEPEIHIEALIPGNARLYDILVLSYDGAPLESGDFHRAQSLRLRMDKPGCPKLYDFQGGSTLKLYPTPDRVKNITGEVILVPRTGTEIIDQKIFDNYGYGLRDGIVSALSAMAGKPWMNIDQAQMTANNFGRVMDEAQALAEGRNQKKARVTSYGGL